MGVVTDIWNFYCTNYATTCILGCDAV